MGWGSSASDNFNKLAKQKQAMAKKMKRGPYDHHAKPALKLSEAPDQDWIKKMKGNW